MDRCPSKRSTTATPRLKTSRAGFTLVELLMVIAIIGMLVALVSVAAVRAIGTARQTQILTEIGLLDSAMQTYKNDTAGAYPPDCSLLTTPANNASGPTAQDVTNRQNRIVAHFRKAFPRLIISGGYGSSSAPTQGTLQWMSINAFSQSQMYGSAGSGVVSGSTPNGKSQWGDFDNMDPAEAMVFWLGGFAIPYPAGGKISYKLIGFASNKVGNASSASPTANGPNSGFGPFNLDVQARDPGPFEFSQGRLGDADGDGWPEYYPPVGQVAQPPNSGAQVANPMPPYVYFDAVSYGYYTTPTTVYPLSAIYPSTSGAGVQPSTSINPSLLTWGTIMPYVQTLPASGNMVWAEPKSFQIISAGLDQQYSTLEIASNLLRVYPAGTNYSQGDLDNLTCFSTGALRDAQP